MNKTKLTLIAFAALFAAVACKPEEVKPDPVANFSISPNDTIEYGETFTFTNTSTDASDYTWSFGDGAVSHAVSPEKTYSGIESGDAYVTFDVTLEAKEGDKSSTITKTVALALPR